MTEIQKTALMADRLKRLEGSPKNIKCGGVVKKLKRQINKKKK